MPAPKLLRTEGRPGTYTETVCTLTDAEIANLLVPLRAFWVGGHREENVPPMPLLVLAFRNAWKHYAGPRRKMYHPGFHAREWSMSDVHLLCLCWATQRPDMKGAWLQHKELANWTARKVLVPPSALPTQAPPKPRVTLPSLPPPPPVLVVPVVESPEGADTAFVGPREVPVAVSAPLPSASAPAVTVAPVRKKPSPMGKAVARAMGALRTNPAADSPTLVPVEEV